MRPSQASNRLEKNPEFYERTVHNGHLPTVAKAGPDDCGHITPLRKFHPAQRQSIETSVAPHTNRRHESRRKDDDDDDVVAVARRFIRETRGEKAKMDRANRKGEYSSTAPL